MTSQPKTRELRRLQDSVSEFSIIERETELEEELKNLQGELTESRRLIRQGSDRGKQVFGPKDITFFSTLILWPSGRSARIDFLEGVQLEEKEALASQTLETDLFTERNH